MRLRGTLLRAQKVLMNDPHARHAELRQKKGPCAQLHWHFVQLRVSLRPHDDGAGKKPVTTA